MDGLPRLLEEQPRPIKKRVDACNTYVHKWRSHLFLMWKQYGGTDQTDAAISRAIDRLVGSVLLLDFCQAWTGVDLRVAKIAMSMGSSTANELDERIVDTLDCPILRAVFCFDAPGGEVVIPDVLFDVDWESSIRNRVRALLGTPTTPMWYFGDYHQLCLANPLKGSSEKQHSSQTRYARGSHYTPAALVDYLTMNVLDSLLEKIPVELIRVLDPACGCAAFLIAAFRYIVQKQESQDGPLDGQAILDTLHRSIYGGDIDDVAQAWTIRLLLLTAKSMINDRRSTSLAVPDLRDNILVGSFLDRQATKKHDESTGSGKNTVSQTPAKFNAILGGPPFVRFSELLRSQPHKIVEYRRMFETAKTGQFDLYMLFIEQSIRLLDETGELGYSVSNTFIRSKSGAAVRRLIGRTTHVPEIIEFEDKALYSDAATQIALLRLSRPKTARQRTRYVHIDGKDDPRPALASLYHRDATDPKIDIRHHDGDTLATSRWNLRPVKSDVTSSGVPIGSLPITLSSGVSSPTDHYFMLDDIGFRAPDLYCTQTRDGKKWEFEKALIHPVVRGRYISGFLGPRCQHVLLFPYSETGHVINEERLQIDFPRTHAYLEMIRPHARSSASGPWYRYRNSTWRPNQTPTIVCSSITSNRGFAFAGQSEALLHASTFGCRLRPGLNADIALLTLNSQTFWDFAIAHMPTTGDGYRAIRLATLRKFRLPRAIEKTPADVADKASTLLKSIRRSLLRRSRGDYERLCAELDEFVASLYCSNR